MLLKRRGVAVIANKDAIRCTKTSEKKLRMCFRLESYYRQDFKDFGKTLLKVGFQSSYLGRAYEEGMLSGLLSGSLKSCSVYMLV